MKDLKGLEPLDYLKILWRRRWYGLGTFVLLIAGSIAYSLTTPDVYKSEALIAVNSAPIPKDYVRPSEVTNPVEQFDAIRLHVRSRSFLEQLIRLNGIVDDGDNEDFVMEEIVDALGKNIQVQSISRNTFSISYVSTDPESAQRVTHYIVDSFIQSSDSDRKLRAIATDQFLDDQIRLMERELESKEEEIREFKYKHIGQLPEHSASNMGVINSLKTKLSEVEKALRGALKRQELMELTKKEQQLVSSEMMAGSWLNDLEMSGDDFPAETNPLLAEKEAELAALLSRGYTEKYPDVQRIKAQIEDIKSQIEAETAQEEEVEQAAASEEIFDPGFGEAEEPLGIAGTGLDFEAEMLRDEIAGYVRDRASILKEINVLEQKIAVAPILEQELSALERQLNLLESQYRSLKNDKFQAKMTTELETTRNSETYTVIDEPNLPEKPVFPNRIQFAVIGFCVAFIAGIAVSFGRELLDTTLGTEEEAASALKLPVLVSIHEISKKQKYMSNKGPLAKSA
jgi:polysaccharide chain length determinant protein (PEP-CTERM system associated)